MQSLLNRVRRHRRGISWSMMSGAVLMNEWVEVERCFANGSLYHFTLTIPCLPAQDPPHKRDHSERAVERPCKHKIN